MRSLPPIRVPVVLVVEDEPLEAANAAEAIALLESRDDIRIVFTDIDMPGGLDGIALAACIRDRWPPISIIMTSGKPWPPRVAIPADTVFFSKPYRQDRVIASLQRMAA